MTVQNWSLSLLEDCSLTDELINGKERDEKDESPKRSKKV